MSNYDEQRKNIPGLVDCRRLFFCNGQKLRFPLLLWCFCRAFSFRARLAARGYFYGRDNQHGGLFSAAISIIILTLKKGKPLENASV